MSRPAARAPSPVPAYSVPLRGRLVSVVVGVALTACGAGTKPDPSLTAAGAAAPATDAGSGDAAAGGEGGSAADSGDQAGSTDAGASGCDIQKVMARPENGCTTSGCHGTSRQAGLDLREPGLAERLVGVPAQGTGCLDEPLIDPADPASSLLLRKVDRSRYESVSTCGALMPLGHDAGISAEDVACFESWVASVVSTTQPPSEPPFKELWENAPVESALLKVKALVNGEPLTPDELRRVQADPSELEPLVRAWASGPGFERKVRGFLANALQQKSIGNGLVDQADVLNFPNTIRRRLIDNLQESFVRTAFRIVDQGRPFSEVVTTTTWDMTTALLALLTFTERDDAERRVRGHWVYGAEPPDGAPQAPPSLEQSIETGFWYASDYPATCAARRLNESTLFDLLFGRSPCDQGQPYLPTTPLIHDTDYEDWRPVTFTSTTDRAARVRFWDLPKLRSASALEVRLPRVGFFTTPAFFDNWPTNADNLFRVTASQTMIAALGKEFSASDTTMPMTLAGLDAVHAAPGTACYSCHIHLDPMRNYFVGLFDPDYQVVASPAVQDAGFAFMEHTSQGGDLYDFAAQIAAHPGFARAWAQKLCAYANSQPCDEQDPAFLDVVKAFEASELDFKTLVVKLFSSPLVTGLSYSDTYGSRDWLVSITRQDHLCPRLDAHLGQADVCGEGAAFIGLIPEDEFARGQAAPVQTAVTSAFHAAAAEALCNRLAVRLVGGRAEQPFAPTDAEAALVRMVDVLLGLPEGHSRRAIWLERLQAHYQAARDAGANQSVALRSAFTLACVSPEVMALGL